MNNIISAEPFCICLYESENGLRRTKHCFMACRGQSVVLQARKEVQDKLDKEKDKLQKAVDYCDTLMEEFGTPQHEGQTESCATLNSTAQKIKDHIQKLQTEE